MHQIQPADASALRWEQQLALICEQRAAIAKRIEEIAGLASRTDELEGYIRTINDLNAAAIRLASLVSSTSI